MLTIGMACYDDFDGVYFSCQALKIFHQIDKKDIELLVVDNNPSSKQGAAVKRYTEKSSYIRYIPMSESTGTTQTRERIFKEASKPYVLCIDCHVLLVPGAIDRLLQYYKQNPECKDLLSGPLLYDNNRDISTHFDLVWRGGMWGTWSKSFKTPADEIICTREKEGGQKCGIYQTSDGKYLRTLDIVYAGHEKELAKQYGYEPLGYSDDDEPFEIQAQGLGIFSCKLSSWPGFNSKFRKFGGEEGYIHEKFRQRGGKALCLPFLKWNHRFDRPNGVPYPIDTLSRVRNYIIGFTELGLTTRDIYEHFVEGDGGVSVADWHKLYNNTDIQVEGNKFIMPKPMLNMNLEQLISWSRKQEVILEPYWDKIKEITDKCDIVSEYTSSGYSSSMFLASDIKVLNTYLTENNESTPIAKYIVHVEKPTTKWNVEINSEPTICYTECLFLNGRANKTTMDIMLSQHNMCGRFLVINNIRGYAQKGDDGGPGMKQVLHDFLRDNPQWFVIDIIEDSRGLVILGKEEKDRPEEETYFYPPGHGPGTELSKILSWFGINATPNCPCRKRAGIMDMRGPKWVEENTDTVLDWLKEEADKRKLPFFRAAGQMVLRRAVKRARKERAKIAAARTQKQ